MLNQEMSGHAEVTGRMMVGLGIATGKSHPCVFHACSDVASLETSYPEIHHMQQQSHRVDGCHQLFSNDHAVDATKRFYERNSEVDLKVCCMQWTQLEVY